MYLVIIGSGNGLSPVRRQAIAWTNVALFANRTLGNKFQWNSNLNSINSIQNMHSIMSSILAAILPGPLCVKATPHDWTSNFIRCWTLHSEAHDSLFYYGCCEHTRDWYGSLQGRFPHNGLFILLLCIYYDLCLAPCTFTVNKLLLLLYLNDIGDLTFKGASCVNRHKEKDRNTLHHCMCNMLE